MWCSERVSVARSFAPGCALWKIRSRYCPHLSMFKIFLTFFAAPWSCVCHVSAMCLPCVCHVSAMCLPCVCHLSAMCLPCVCHVSAMCLPCVCHVSAMCLPCFCHGPWVCHVPATYLPCVCHVAELCVTCVCQVSSMCLPGGRAQCAHQTVSYGVSLLTTSQEHGFRVDSVRCSET
jgi:hypothetical protein